MLIYVKAKTALLALKPEDGQDLIEYALLGALIAVACVASMQAVATAIVAEFGKITTAMP